MLSMLLVRSEDAILRCTLQSLACGKKKVLKKSPAGKYVNDEDVFAFNDAFEDPHAKVHINTIQVKETVSAPFFSSTILCSEPRRLHSPRNRNARRRRSRATGSITSMRRLCVS